MTTARLLLMRHAKSDWYSGEQDDYLRPLTERGSRDARHMGRWLAAHGHLPASIVSSPSRRTRDTLRMLGEGAGQALEAITTWDDAVYLASSAQLVRVLQRHGRRDNVMLLGHNPGLEDLLAWLVPATARASPSNKPFPTGAVYVLAVEPGVDGITAGCAAIVDHQRPKQLRE